MFKEQRADPRERLEMPLRLGDGSHAVTRDISASGLYFEMNGEHQVAGLVDFQMELPDMHMRFVAVGEIVRVEHKFGTTGIAVKLLSPRLEPME